MPAATTLNQQNVYVSNRPAWERQVTMSADMPVELAVSRGGFTQANARSVRCRWRIQWEHYRDAAGRRAATLENTLQGPCIVPFWPLRVLSATALALGGTAVTLSGIIDREFWWPGDWVYFYGASEADPAQFRQIASVSGQALTLTSLGGSLAFAAGSRCAPCRTCVRDSGQIDLRASHEQTQIERASFLAL